MSYAFLPICLLTLTLAVTQPAAAGRWEVCKLTLKIDRLVTGATQRIHATLTGVDPQSATAECPSVGAPYDFFPETADYQYPLRRKDWPAVGQTVRWRYIYLDGTCKNDGNPAACRIRHHPMGW
jgi:hypothetical protein